MLKKIDSMNLSVLSSNLLLLYFIDFNSIGILETLFFISGGAWLVSTVWKWSYSVKA